MRFEQPVSADLVFDVDLLTATPRSKEVIERLFVLTREGVSKSAIQEFQQQKDASSPFLIAAVLRSDSLVGVLRRELRRISPGAKLNEEELRAVLTDEVLKREVVFGDDAKVAASRVRRAANRALRNRTKSRAPSPEPSDNTDPAESPTS